MDPKDISQDNLKLNVFDSKVTNSDNIDKKKLETVDSTAQTQKENHIPSNESWQQQIHIPYILNGELYEIQTQKGENVTVKCCNCPPDRVYRGSVRSTGNFHMHIKRRHPDLMSKLHEMKVNALLERRDRLIKQRHKISPPHFQRLIKRRLNALTTETPSLKGNAINVVLTSKMETKTVPLENCYNYDNNSKNSKDALNNELKSMFVKPRTDTLDTKVEDNVSVVSETHVSSASSSISSICCLYSLPSNNSPNSTSINDTGKKNKYSEKGNELCISNKRPFIKPEMSVVQECPSVSVLNMDNLTTLTTMDPIDLSKSKPSVKTTLKDNDVSYETNDANKQNIRNEISAASLTETLLHLSDTLIGIQRAMTLRNQLESNRILFDVAKFKFLHPEFVFDL